MDVVKSTFVYNFEGILGKPFSYAGVVVCCCGLCCFWQCADAAVAGSCCCCLGAAEAGFKGLLLQNVAAAGCAVAGRVQLPSGCVLLLM
ncbi:hypothetical protein LOK49_LG08G00673 [Camellia lanceoleosa]|uniref:Uncharacterized protein n=1 Tax=Camellia lanceoleosa TaxID=1840588 RepID=A0ACC0GSW8_9ERIC|nr:hypothetical protein LOK49_LG08G00673 [Camellia lanceoleosa]